MSFLKAMAREARKHPEAMKRFVNKYGGASKAKGRAKAYSKAATAGRKAKPISKATTKVNPFRKAVPAKRKAKPIRKATTNVNPFRKAAGGSSLSPKRASKGGISGAFSRYLFSTRSKKDKLS